MVAVTNFDVDGSLDDFLAKLERLEYPKFRLHVLFYNPVIYTISQLFQVLITIFNDNFYMQPEHHMDLIRAFTQSGFFGGVEIFTDEDSNAFNDKDLAM